MLQFFIKGGPVMYFLLLCSFVGVYISIQKLLYLRINKVDQDLLVERVKNRLVTIGAEQTVKELRSERDIMSRAVSYIVRLLNLPREEIQDGIKAATLLEISKLEKNMNLLSSLITVAPLLGLLGTVLGLMDIFHVISGGGIGDSAQLSSGIAQALITTVTGLSIAIPFIFVYQYLAQKIDQFIIDTEKVMHEIINFSKLQGGIKP